MHSLFLEQLSTRAIRGSAGHFSSLVLLTAHRIHWLFKTDTCSKVDVIAARSTLHVAELQQTMCISWYIYLLDYNIPIREGSYRLTRELSQRIESATLSLYKV